MSVISYKYKVYRQNANHVRRLNWLLGVASEVYNHALSVRVRYYRLFRKRLSLQRLQSHMARVRRSRPEWKIINSQSVQQICERIEEGYERFIRREAKRPPQHKSRKVYKSVTFKSSGYTLNGNVLTVNALNLRLKFHMSRPIAGKVQRVNLKRDSLGDFWISVSVKDDDVCRRYKPMTGRTAGFDFGLRHFLTSDDGTTIDSPQPLLQHVACLRRLSRALSRKVRGSNSRKRAKAALARLHARIANLRADFHWRLADRLVSMYDVLCFESLDMRQMVREWGRKVCDLGFADFLGILEYKCLVSGKRFVRIDRWAATSKTCSVCGHREEVMPLRVREWVCPCCGTRHDRDVNAAKNILRVGASTLDGGAVRPVFAGKHR